MAMETGWTDDWIVLWSIEEPINLCIVQTQVSLKGSDYQQVAVEVRGKPMGSVAVACRGDEVLLVHSHRAVVGQDMWEFPRGFGEVIDRSDEFLQTLLNTARRELMEECGLGSISVHLLGFVHPNSGLLRERVSVVRLDIGISQEFTPGEEVGGCRWISRASLRREIREGKITDGFTLSAAMLLESIGE